jgi:hypothetical protein
VSFPDRDKDDWGEATPPAPSVVTEWVELELLDDDGAPLAGERWVAKLADGTTREGRLGEHGRARLEVPAGPCVVTFPDRDQDDWIEAPVTETRAVLA